MHDMTHAWQCQLGYGVIRNGLLSWAADYGYSLDANKKLSSYKMEPQACVLADYFVLIRHGQGM